MTETLDLPRRRGRTSCPARGRACLVFAVALAAAPAGLAAQALAHPLVPAGRVRLDFVPSVMSWDTRYGLRLEDGSVVEEEEALGSDLTDPRGVSLFPGVVTLEEAIRSLADDGFQGNLGSATGRLSKEITRLDMGLRLGVFEWLTVGGNVPYVKGSTSLDFAFRADPDANLGLNPAITGDAGVGELLSGLGEAAVAAGSWAGSMCGSGTSQDCTAAQALAGRAEAFWQGLLGAYFASPFFPLQSAPVASRLQGALAELDAALLAAGLPGVGSSLPFATRGVDEETFLGLPSDPAAGIGGSPLQGEQGLWQLGDVEVNATLRLLEGERRDSGAATPRLAYGLYGTFLVRLGTGVLDDPDVFLDIGSGDGQMDLEGRVDGILRVGAKVDLRGAFLYGTQQAVDIVRRVAPHETLLPLATTTRVVTWSPGDYSLLEISPRYRVADALSLSAEYRRFHKGQDGYALSRTTEEGVTDEIDVSVLARETEVTLQEVALGLRYSSLALWRQGEVGTPVELGVRLIRPLAGSGGQTPKATRVEFSLSLFRRIWGG